jgi:large exoprotein involved in heme utilization and adhesion
VTDKLDLDHAAITAQTANSNGGNVRISVGRLFHLYNSEVTTSVGGGTGNGGNVLLNEPNFLVLNKSRIEANAREGSGGDITIRTGKLTLSPDSVIGGSSIAQGTDNIVSLVVSPKTFLNASSQLREACAARGGRRTSSFKPGGRGGLPPDPGTPLMATPSGQPLKQQTATGSPTALTPRPPQAAKPIMVAGTPQPVLSFPRLTCRG